MRWGCWGWDKEERGKVVQISCEISILGVKCACVSAHACVRMCARKRVCTCAHVTITILSCMASLSPPPTPIMFGRCDTPALYRFSALCLGLQKITMGNSTVKTGLTGKPWQSTFFHTDFTKSVCKKVNFQGSRTGSKFLDNMQEEYKGVDQSLEGRKEITEKGNLH